MSLEDKKGMNDLMQRSLKHIQMLATFDKYKLLLLYDNNHYIYIYAIHHPMCRTHWSIT
jgi:hypothetical protein